MIRRDNWEGSSSQPHDEATLSMYKGLRLIADASYPRGPVPGATQARRSEARMGRPHEFMTPVWNTSQPSGSVIPDNHPRLIFTVGLAVWSGPVLG